MLVVVSCLYIHGLFTFVRDWLSICYSCAFKTSIFLTQLVSNGAECIKILNKTLFYNVAYVFSRKKQVIKIKSIAS